MPERGIKYEIMIVVKDGFLRSGSLVSMTIYINSNGYRLLDTKPLNPEIRHADLHVVL